MKTEEQMAQGGTVEANLTPLTSVVEMTRSAGNIAQWLTYLPQDCVAAMVRQGWDRTVC